MNKQTIKRIMQYLKKYLFQIACTLVFALITVGLTLYVPILLGQGIDFIIAANNVDFVALSNILIKVLIAVLLTGVSQWCMNIINNRITNAVVMDIRVDAFNRIQNMPLKYIDTHTHGEISSKIITDVDTFAEGLLMGFTQLFTGILTILGTLVYMFIINWIIALVVVVITPVSLFVAKYIATKTYSMFKLQSETRGEQTGFIDEMIGNLKVVKAYNHEDENQDKFDEINDRLSKCSLKAIFFSSLTNPATRFVNSLVYAGVVLSGSLMAISGVAGLTITVGSLSCFLSYANQYTKPFNEISSVITELQNAIACASRIFELIDEKTEIKDEDNAVVIENPNGDIKLENVYFSYIPEKPLITNFNLHVLPGQKIAIVGPTGCGKTTLINLLMRFYDVNSGTIKVDDNKIVDVTRHSLRYNFGMVLQETWIRNASVRDNIAIGKKDASLEEVITACERSHADSFIRRLPNGYDTIISDEGNLSQGEKQLLCIARIMLCLPPMLILDEATSSIDTRTEIKIQEAFATLMNGRTSFIVAHRLSTIQNADIILVMNNGNVIEQGSHDELLLKKGFYYNLYNSQFAK